MTSTTLLFGALLVVVVAGMTLLYWAISLRSHDEDEDEEEEEGTAAKVFEDPNDPLEDILDDDLAEQLDEDHEPDTPAEAKGLNTGAKIREAVANVGWWITGFVGGIAGATVRKIPKSGTLFRRMAIKSLENYHRKAGGDAIGLEARAGQQLDFTPVKYRPPEECDEGEKPGWKAKGEDKVWNAGSEGRVVDYLGRTPIVALDRDSHVEAGWLRPRIAEAIELDSYSPVYANPDMEVTIDAGPNPGAAGQPARADGGYNYQLDINDHGEWMGDALVNLDSGEGYDGMRISFRKATEWMAETTTTQEMQMQEDRGYLRGLAGSEQPSMFKILLLCGAIIVGALAVVIIGPELVGGGGGGGGINPLSMALMGLLG